jgi:2-polyprenyl-3-methyl-5-hydroxy-6-metoxy-1,4-benzoquinol methylase
MKCRICSNEKKNQIYEAKEMMFGYKDLFHYFQCSSCKCLQIRDIPLSMSKYYPDNYYSYEPISRQNKIKRFNLFKVQLIRMRNNYAVFGKGFIGKLLYAKYPNTNLRILSPLSVSKDTKILDVGCGAGSLLCLLSELGFNNLLGVDPFIAKDIEYDNGFKILKREIHDVEGNFDLVMFHHSLEHVPDPAGTLNIVSLLLTPGGHCLIRTPTVSSYAWDHYGVNWVQLDAPRHFYLHSIESMKILAGQAGLDLYKVVYDSTSFQFWGSEQYIKGIPLKDKRSYSVCAENSIFSKEEISAFEKRAGELNETKQGDQAIFYLRKS